MRRLAMVLLAWGLTAASADARTPDWMAGHWLSCERQEQVSETWVGPGSGVLLGSNLTQSTGRTSFEQLRVASGTQGGLSYFASPNGAPATEFSLIAQDNRRVVFENRAHDFPQRIAYERDGDRLTARVEGVVNGRSEATEWRFRAARLGENCPAR